MLRILIALVAFATFTFAADIPSGETLVVGGNRASDVSLPRL